MRPTVLKPFTALSKAAGAGCWLSIIIPTLNERTTLPACLEFLSDSNTDSEVEIIIADAGSTDGTCEYVATQPSLRLLHCTRGRAQQLNAGANVARGAYLWFLHADTLPPKNWRENLISAQNRGLPACFNLYFSGQQKSPLLRFYARGSRLNHWAVRFGDQSLFLSREQFEQSGGYRIDHLLMEGHEMAKRVRKQNGGFIVLPTRLTTSSRRYQEYGVIFTQAVYVLIFGLYYLGANQQRLVNIYRWAFPDEIRKRNYASEQGKKTRYKSLFGNFGSGQN